MHTIECKFREFFDVLKKCIENGDDIKISDEPEQLKCGFVVNGKERYLTKVKELEYAKDSGIDVSIYNNLKAQ